MCVPVPITPRLTTGPSKDLVTVPRSTVPPDATVWTPAAQTPAFGADSVAVVPLKLLMT